MARAIGEMNKKLHWSYPHHIARIHFHPWIGMLKFPELAAVAKLGGNDGRNA